MTRRRDLAGLVVLVGFTLAAVAHYLVGQYFERDYPASTFLFKPGDGIDHDPEDSGFGRHLFGDLYQPWKESSQDSPYVAPTRFYRSNYPPLAHLLLRPLTLLPYQVTIAVVLGVTLAGTGWLLHRALPGEGLPRVQQAFVLTALTGPMLFLLDRGNLDGLVLVLLLGALVPVRSGRAPAVLLGLAAALKIYPAVFLLLSLRRRDWRGFAVSVATGAVTTVVALLTFDGGPVRNALRLKDNLGEFAELGGPDNTLYVQHTVSLTSLVKVVDHYLALPAKLVNHVGLLSVGGLLVVVLAVLLLQLAHWESTFLLATAVTVLLANTYEYRLVLFLVPLALLVRESDPARRVTVMTGLVALLLVPLALPVLYADVALGVLVHPLLVIAVAAEVVLRALAARLREPAGALA